MIVLKHLTAGILVYKSPLTKSFGQGILNPRDVIGKQASGTRAPPAVGFSVPGGGETRCVGGASVGKSRMNTKTGTWQKRFGLTTCAATTVETAIPGTALGVAVIYTTEADRETILLIVESRAGSLRSQCLKRLASSKLPPAATLTVAFIAESLSSPAPEAIHEACRNQVLLAAEMRRELRPAMR